MHNLLYAKEESVHFVLCSIEEQQSYSTVVINTN